jgi:hypothetical protein
MKLVMDDMRTMLRNAGGEAQGAESAISYQEERKLDPPARVEVLAQG